MRSTELFRSCANEHVAAAAMACIGGQLHRKVSTVAHDAGLTKGALVSRLIADFDRKASPRRRKSLEKSMTRHPMPILAGLRLVVETALEGDWNADDKQHAAAPAPVPARPWPHAATLCGEPALPETLHS